MDTYSLKYQFHNEAKQLRNLNNFWLGYIIYFGSYTLTSTGYVNFIVFQAFQTIGIGLIVVASIHLINSKIDNAYLSFLFFLFCTWSFLLIIRGYSNFLDYNYIKRFLFDPTYGGITYFVPLILLFAKQNFYKKLFDIILLFGIFCILFDVVFIKDLISFQNTNPRSLGIVEASADLSFPCAFILLTYPYHTNKRILLAAAVMLLTFLFAIMRARRGLILMTSSVLVFSYLLYIFTSKTRLVIIYFTILIGLLGLLYASNVYRPRDNRVFGYILERGDEDTRTGVEIYFYADMEPLDWIIGRGINGEYFCPDMEPDQETDYRTVIETGYLQIILKGGIVSLGLFVLIAIPAIIKGLFYSKNVFSKAAAIWIFWVTISMYPAVVNSFTLRYILVWIAIGICYSKAIRNMCEEDIKKLLYGESYQMN
jgi:hypothetical protein